MKDLLLVSERQTHFHDDEVNDEHFALVIELADVDPAEVVRPASVVERRHAAVVRSDVQSRPSRILTSSHHRLIVTLFNTLLVPLS